MKRLTFEEIWSRNWWAVENMKKEYKKEYYCRTGFYANAEYMDAQDARIKELEADSRKAHSFIINCIDNWNHLRDVLSNVNNTEGVEFDDCCTSDFLEIKEFSEVFAMNTFKEWIALERTKYNIDNLDEHEKFKDIFWQTKEENKCE